MALTQTLSSYQLSFQSRVGSLHNWERFGTKDYGEGFVPQGKLRLQCLGVILDQPKELPE